ncbi:hypothetical protein JAAARDRAFT_492266 [Jaapia argillacea MUCL 33604]|uniref:Uncharacterized protein n=1 Tax=Jaapia argillacea MUCL 33604 TaxID=933084 RepID=A0A067PAN2_9AGAM|nr:hypothetical protein JAAARDRAFT_492266 [Jaapia argillacea MUCL 33604]
MTTSTTHDHLQGILDAQDTILLSLSTLARMFKDVSKTINKWGVKQEEGIWVRFQSYLPRALATTS